MRRVKRKKGGFTRTGAFDTLAPMFKRALAVLAAPLLLAGCTTTFTNLTPQTQVRNAEHLYPVEVSFVSPQQTLRWETIRPQIVIGKDFYPMRATPVMTNRWEGLVPIPADKNLVHYRYKFDFQFNRMGAPGNDSALSPEYTVKVIEDPAAPKK